jgi:hypothetical protein
LRNIVPTVALNRFRDRPCLTAVKRSMDVLVGDVAQRAPLHHSPEIVKAINAQSLGRVTSSHFAVIPVLSSRAKFLNVDLSAKLLRYYPSAYFRIAL